MKEKPILFSGEMVRALLRSENPKTQTRRIINPQPHRDAVAAEPVAMNGWLWRFGELEQPGHFRCDHGMVGDRLWVRETWRARRAYEAVKPSEIPTTEAKHIYYEADLSGDENASVGKVRQSIFMLRWASRITLEITGVRVERLQSISEADAQAEGVRPLQLKQDMTEDEKLILNLPLMESQNPYRTSYALLWDSINIHRASWKSNPWVWVLEFKRV